MLDFDPSVLPTDPAFLKKMQDRAEKFALELKAAKKPFGLADILVSAGLGIIFVLVASGAGVLVSKLIQ